MLPADLGDRPVDHAVAGGHAADRVGLAFAAGYRAALRALVPGAPARTSLCATEKDGNHPRAIATTLDDALRLRGTKTWVTMAPEAELLLVVASTGMVDGRNRLRLVRVAPTAPGVTITALPPPPFAPEIGHATVTFDTALVADDLLPGDGYDDYLKPFRTVEDIHVHAALLAWALGLAERHDWPREWTERALTVIAALRQLAAAPPLAPATHVALAGAIALTRGLVDEAPWQTLDADALARWQRDRPLLEVAGKARAARREAAWRTTP